MKVVLELALVLFTVPVFATHTVQLTWTHSSSAGVTGYNVYRGGVSGGPYQVIASGVGYVTTYTDTNVLSGSTYYYVVTAIAGSAESIYSNQATAVIPKDNKCDPNSDGVTNILDVQLLINVALGKTTCPN
jgi:fibronectin type 3 domain-containing protein